jgi:hypothetical protein
VQRASQTRLNVLACPGTERFERSGQRASQTSLCFSSVWSVWSAWKMSFEEIISEVQGKPEIWISHHPLYKSRATAKKTWNEIVLNSPNNFLFYYNTWILLFTE